MNKTWTSLASALLLSATLAAPALAAPQLDYVTDDAGILDAEEIDALSQQAAEIEDATGCTPYIITVDNYMDIVGSDDIEYTAEEVYLGYELGYGEDQSGILLLLSMENRKYALYAFGFGNTAFTDYGKEYLADEFVDDFGDDDWYEGFADYLSTGGEMIGSALEGEAIDVGMETGLSKILATLLCMLMGLGIAALVRAGLKSQLDSVKLGTEAKAFVSGGGLSLSLREDDYRYTTQSRVYDPQEKSSSGGGGTSLTDSGGSSSSGDF